MGRNAQSRFRGRPSVNPQGFELSKYGSNMVRHALPIGHRPDTDSQAGEGPIYVRVTASELLLSLGLMLGPEKQSLATFRRCYVGVMRIDLRLL